ncbi:MAG: pentapeptide repeat-containing protein [Pseudomonadota bacterium]|nr:pentapeptide repeat-containing protein [Pseudomonadota bacterium]
MSLDEATHDRFPIPAEPDDGLSPEERGKLLLQHVKEGLAVGSFWGCLPAFVPTVSFVGAVLPEDTELHAATLSGVRLCRTKLPGLQFPDATVRDGDFREAQMDGAYACGADLYRADFSRASLRDAWLMGVTAIEASFAGADLTGASFGYAILRGVSFAGARLDGVVWTEADVDLATCKLSGWSVAEILGRHAAGMRLHDIERFPPEVLRALIGARAKPSTPSEWIVDLRRDVGRALEQLEATRHRQQGCDEALLRTTVHIYLLGRGYDATAETERGGHTDLLVQERDLGLTWIAECKVYTDLGKLLEGLHQLHTRYATGSEVELALVVFCFEPDAVSVARRWRERLNEERPCGMSGEPLDDDYSPLSFFTRHTHEGSGREILTHHRFAALYWKPADRSGRRARAPKAKRQR